MPVTDGQIWVIKKLAELGKLFYKTTIKHSYPYLLALAYPAYFPSYQAMVLRSGKDKLKERAVACRR